MELCSTHIASREFIVAVGEAPWLCGGGGDGAGGEPAGEIPPLLHAVGAVTRAAALTHRVVRVTPTQVELYISVQDTRT